jgi:hypothetical protein
MFYMYWIKESFKFPLISVYLVLFLSFFISTCVRNFHWQLYCSDIIQWKNGSKITRENMSWKIRKVHALKRMKYCYRLQSNITQVSNKERVTYSYTLSFKFYIFYPHSIWVFENAHFKIKIEIMYFENVFIHNMCR